MAAAIGSLSVPSFNPCCDGSLAEAALKNLGLLEAISFNPCCDGSLAEAPP